MPIELSALVGVDNQSTGLEKTKRMGGNTSFTHSTPNNTKLLAGSQDFFGNNVQGRLVARRKRPDGNFFIYP
ncbi:MAG: hypothetical protein ACRENG_22230 [bacterium]